MKGKLKDMTTDATLSECSSSSTNDHSVGLDDAFFGQWDISESNIMGFESCASWLGIQDAVKEAPAPKDLPRLRKDSSQENLEFMDSNLKNDEEIESNIPPEDGWTAAMPYKAMISNAYWLTKPEVGETTASRLESWGETRRVVHMELDLGDSGIKYSPGDSIGVCVPNPRHLVESVSKCLKELKEDKGITPKSVVNSKVTPGVKSIIEILTYHVDLVSVPRKASVFSLAQLCSDESLFQLDGNLGLVAAMVEMLVQSHVPGVIHLLPALPSEWIPSCTRQDGERAPVYAVRGLQARGDVEVGVEWTRDCACKEGEVGNCARLKEARLLFNSPHAWHSFGDNELFRRFDYVYSENNASTSAASDDKKSEGVTIVIKTSTGAKDLKFVPAISSKRGKLTCATLLHTSTREEEGAFLTISSYPCEVILTD